MPYVGRPFLPDADRVDEHSRECPAIDVPRKFTSEDVLERLSNLFVR